MEIIEYNDKISIYTFQRKPDILCSNSFIIKTPETMIVIDPGGCSDQIAAITDIIKKNLVEKSYNILIVLTHCHIDHSLQAFQSREFRSIPDNRICIHESGFNAYCKNDYAVTQADLFSKQFYDCIPDIKLFADFKDGKSGCINFGNGQSIEFEYKKYKIPGSQELKCQIIKLKEINENFEIYHTPGHSPDSIIIKFDNMIFLGDILFAGNPLIAGIVGWNYDDYVESIKKLLWIFENQKIEKCFNGHGNSIDSKTVISALEKILKDLACKNKSGHKYIFDKKKMEFMFEYAFDTLSELCITFTIISGRIAYLSFQLEKLEEFEAANNFWNSEECGKIELLIIEFNSFIEHYKKGRKFKIEVIHKALNIIQKLNKLYKTSKHFETAGKVFLRRAETLLFDFLKIVSGYETEIIFGESDLNLIIKNLVSDLKRHKKENAAKVLDSIDDNKSYIDYLVNQIADIDIFKNMVIRCELEKYLQHVFINENLFTDILTGLFEDFVCFEFEDVHLKTYTENEFVYLEIFIQKPNIFTENKIDFFKRRLKIVNADFIMPSENVKNETRILIKLYPFLNEI